MKNPPMATARNAARTAEHSARETATNPWTQRIARCGFATKGIIYVLIGVLAAKAAVGAGGKTTDNHGAIVTLSEQPFGRALVALVAVGLFAYALWLFVEAALDPEGEGRKTRGIGARLGDAILGCSYALLGVVATQLALARHASGTSSDAATRDWTGRLLAHPFGAVVVALAGLVVLGIAGFFFFQAVRAQFRDELDLNNTSETERRWVVRLGRVGFASLGAVNIVVGIFLIIAAVRHNAGEAKGLGDALSVLAQRPYGGALLGVVALGLIAYGLYTFAEARYRRLVRT